MVRSEDRRVLAKIKSKFEKRHRLLSETLSDAFAAQCCMQYIALTPNHNCIQGYIQKIIAMPFGMLLISDIQVCLDFFVGISEIRLA